MYLKNIIQYAGVTCKDYTTKILVKFFLCLTADQILCRQKKVSFDEKYIMSLTSVLCCFLSTNWKLCKSKEKARFLCCLSNYLGKVFISYFSHLIV